MLVVAAILRENVSPDKEHSAIDVTIQIDVTGPKGGQPTKFYVVSRSSFYSCYGETIDISRYYNVIGEYGNDLYRLQLENTFVKVPKLYYNLFNCKGGNWNVGVPLSTITCYSNGVDIFKGYRLSISVPIAVNVKFSSSSMTYEGVKFNRAGSTECTTSVNPLIAILVAAAVVIVLVIIVKIIVKSCNNSKTLPKKCDSLLDTRKANESIQ